MNAPVPSPAPGAPGRAADVYGGLIEVAREIYKNIAPAPPDGTGEVRHITSDAAPALLPLPHEAVRQILSLLRSGDQEILALADRSATDHFLFSHVANVAIYSLRLGLAAGLSEDELGELGIAAFLHDVGLAGHMELTARLARLTEAETRVIHGHVEEGRHRLDAFTGWTGDLRDTLHRVIGETHERANGEGYPKGLGKDEIHPYAQIIGLADVYEAMTHLRPWRPRTVPHEVLRSLLEENAADFNPELIRVFVEALSLYPPGSFVRLSTGEVGRVLSATPGLPLRPKVWVMIDAEGKRVETTRVVNLATQPLYFVAEAVDESKITTTDPRLSLALRAQRWWVRGL